MDVSLQATSFDEAKGCSSFHVFINAVLLTCTGFKSHIF